ncbi:MAG: hypothetical protein H6613_18480 [Ignavibacteriales bacterium]|nr:hypothetical protein [Ignavibacteriales bacterium]
MKLLQLNCIFKDDQSNNFNVARIENTSLGTDADGLAILINVGTQAASNHFIRFQKKSVVQELEISLGVEVVYHITQPQMQD